MGQSGARNVYGGDLDLTYLCHNPKTGAVKLILVFLETTELILSSGAVNVYLTLSLVH